MISPFKIKPFFIRVVHTLHESCSFFLLRMYASEDWAFKCRCPSCKCRQATARWQHGRFSAYHTWASLFFFVLLLLSNPDSHTLPVKHLWFLFFFFFLFFFYRCPWHHFVFVITILQSTPIAHNKELLNIRDFNPPGWDIVAVRICVQINPVCFLLKMNELRVKY